MIEFDRSRPVDIQGDFTGFIEYKRIGRDR